MDNRRTSSNCWVGHTQDSVTLAVVNRIAELVQIPSSHAESFQVLHYENSQEYQPHLDTFDPDDKGYLPYLKNGGQRVVTALAYLSDVIKGGETSFPNVEKIVSPERGKIVVFHLVKRELSSQTPMLCTEVCQSLKVKNGLLIYGSDMKN